MSSTQVTLSSKAKVLYQNGQLVEAIKELIQEVRNDPNNNWLRTFLFELLCFNGEWERAERQLKGLSIIGAKAEIGLLVYGNNIKAEIQRDKVFSNAMAPNFLFTPPNYISLQLAAVKKLQEQNYLETRSLLDELALNQPTLKGKLNGKKFSNFVDYNDFLANCLEVFLEDKYYWLPFENIQRLQVQPPKLLRDLVWAKAIVQLTNDTLVEVFLPTLYPNSYKHENELVRLGRMTDWKALPNEIYLGYGLRTFFSDKREKTIFEINELAFDHS
ncbi:MAG: hypothetical protein JNM06_05050 [Blastocatellia bacterium]|nr:hypothetical protein [Blastocatellia bacterium]